MCVGLLISFNYLVLYAVVIVPFVLIAMKEKYETVLVDGVEVPCEEAEGLCEEQEELDRVDFNNFVLLVNGAMLFYSVLCESIILCKTLKPAGAKCNSYLICQLITGLSMRAVILISCQLIAVFIQDVDFVNFVLGVSLVGTLVFSQVRAVHIWLASIKKDKKCTSFMHLFTRKESCLSFQKCRVTSVSQCDEQKKWVLHYTCADKALECFPIEHGESKC